MNIDAQRLIGKRFVVAIITICVLSAISCALTVLFIMQRVTFADITTLLSSAIFVIGAVAGAFMGAQTITDNNTKGESGDE